MVDCAPEYEEVASVCCSFHLSVIGLAIPQVVDDVIASCTDVLLHRVSRNPETLSQSLSGWIALFSAYGLLQVSTFTSNESS